MNTYNLLITLISSIFSIFCFKTSFDCRHVTLKALNIFKSSVHLLQIIFVISSRSEIYTNNYSPSLLGKPHIEFVYLNSS
jgi:hypothetical protein